MNRRVRVPLSAGSPTYNRLVKLLVASIAILATTLIALATYLVVLQRAGSDTRVAGSPESSAPERSLLPASTADEEAQSTRVAHTSTAPVAGEPTQDRIPETPSPGPAPGGTETVPELDSPTRTPVSTVLLTAVPTPAPLLQEALSWQQPVVPSDDELRTMIAGMPLQDKVAQMLIVGFHGRSIAESPELATMVGDYHVGGLVLLEANAHDPAQLHRLTAELQALAASSGQGIPLFITLNHEGGIVVRITEGVTGFPGNMAIAATGSADNAYVAAVLAAFELRLMGINMNLAPVLDVNDNPLNPIIGTRAFGDSPEVVAEFGRLAVRGTRDAGVIPVVKHFPGHGGVAADSHGVLPVLDKTAEQLSQHELVPFQAAIDEGVGAIMTAHISVPALDASGLPATLSAKVLSDLLREQMGYDGLIMTDSLGMAGVSGGRGQVQAALQAVEAGADLLLSTAPMDKHIKIIQALRDAVLQGEIEEERIDRSVLRILRAKYAYGLFEPAPPLDLGGVGSAEHQAAADEMARQAVTVLRDDDNLILLAPAPLHLLLISPHELPLAPSGSRTTLAAALRQAGHQVKELVFNPASTQSRNDTYAAAVNSAASYDRVIFGEWELVKRYVNLGETWQEDLLRALYRQNPALIVVAWHNPAAVLQCDQVPAFLTAYGNTRAQVSAVAAVLLGQFEAVGHLPIALPGQGE